MNTTETASSATKSAEAAKFVGACTCGASRLSQCSCEWGKMIDDLMRVGYRTDSPIELANALPGLLAAARDRISRARERAIRSAWSRWTGSATDLADELHIAPARVRKLRTRSI